MFYLVTSFIMFLFITAKWTFWWAEVLPIPGGGRTGIVAQLPRLTRTAYRFKETVLKLTVLLGDAIATYRLWILSNRNKPMIVFPIAGLLGFLACTIALEGPENKTGSTLRPIVNGKLVLAGWDIAVTVCTLSVTLYVTFMITWIIMKSRLRVASNVIEQGVKQILVVIIESAALCTLWNLFFFIAGLGFKSEFALSLLDCMPGVYGVSVMLINVRVGLGWARSESERNAVSSSSVISRRNFPRSPEQRGIYISTVVYTEPTGPAQRDNSESTGDIELGDKVNVSLPTSGKPYPM